jgi:hypothetical protein
MKKFCSCLLFLLLLLLMQSCKKSTPKPLCGDSVSIGILIDTFNFYLHPLTDTTAGAVSSYIEGGNRVFSYVVSSSDICPRDSVGVSMDFSYHSGPISNFVKSRAKVEWGNNNSLIVTLTPNFDSTQFSSGVVKIDISSSYNNTPGSVKVTLELYFPTRGNFQTDQIDLNDEIGALDVGLGYALFN